jgi:uncharacterized protein YjbJ (UPF0337 family)
MSQSETHQFKSKWKLQIGPARIAWARLTEDELVAADGQQDKLVDLLQERYDLSRDEARRRVTNFLAMRGC